jgi:hypothetical protein
LIECCGIKELNVRKNVVCVKYLSSKQKYDDQCFSKSIGGIERERQRERDWVEGERKTL